MSSSLAADVRLANSKEYSAKLWAEIKADPELHAEHKRKRREYRASRPELKETPEQSILRRYRLTWDQVYALWKAQGESCAICKTVSKRWHVDHDHACCPGEVTCGKCIRGILCPPCNMALGLFKDKAASLRAAANYLERSDLYVD